MLEHFNCRIHIEPDSATLDYEAYFMEHGADGMPNICLIPIMAGVFYNTVIKAGFADFVSLSTYINHSPTERILAKTRIGMF